MRIARLLPLNSTIGLLLIIGSLLGVIGITHPVIWDEHSYVMTALFMADHFPQLDIINYYVDDPRFIANPFPVVATPPGALVVYSSTGALTGFHLPTLRIITLIITIMGLLIFYKTLILIKQENASHKMLLLLTYPYVLIMSITVQSDMIALVVFLGHLYYIIRFIQDKPHAIVGASLLGVAALLTRQDYLFIVPAMMGVVLLEAYRKKTSLKTIVTQLIWCLLPFMALLILFIAWGGLLPSSYLVQQDLDDQHKVAWSGAKFLFIFSLIGIYFFPSLFGSFQSVKQGGKIRLIAGSFGVLVFLLTWWWREGFVDCEGILCAASMTTPYPIWMLLGVSAFAGAYLLIRDTWVGLRIPTVQSYMSVALIYLGFIILSQAATTLIRQRYFLPAIPILLMMLYRATPGKMMMAWWILLAMSSLGYIAIKIHQGGVLL